MKNCCFWGQNYRTLWDSALTNAKGTSKGAFIKMVPLDEGARALHSASLAYAQDLGRFAPRPTSQHYGVAR